MSKHENGTKKKGSWHLFSECQFPVSKHNVANEESELECHFRLGIEREADNLRSVTRRGQLWITSDYGHYFRIIRGQAKERK